VPCGGNWWAQIAKKESVRAYYPIGIVDEVKTAITHLSSASVFGYGVLI